MDDPHHRALVTETLQAALQADSARTRVLAISGLGLVEMTRHRTRQSLAEILCCPCGSCEGSGYVKSAPTIANDVVRRIGREAAITPAQSEIVASVHPTIAHILTTEHGTTLEAIAGRWATKVRVQPTVQGSPERYSVRILEPEGAGVR